jgi:hypothetical protein
MAERESVNPHLKDQAFSTFLDQNPPFELWPKKWDFAFDTPAKWPVIDNNAPAHAGQRPPGLLASR